MEMINEIEHKTVNSEEQILLSAKTIFLRDGFAVARMQDIADEAGINKALLHYYYRSKEKLFQAVFISIMKQVIEELGGIMQSELHLFDKIRLFFDMHISFMQKNHYVPGFIIGELNRNPQLVIDAMMQINVQNTFGGFVDQVKDAVEKGEIKSIDPRQLFINMLALSVFPFGARGMLFGILHFDETQFNSFVEERKTLCADMIIKSITNL
jgi:AcrR family transcriptional regulator